MKLLLKLLWLLVHLFILMHQPVEGSHILVLFPMASKSHKIAAVPFIEALAARGHKLSVISSFPPAKELPNINEFYIGGLPAIEKHFKEQYDFEYDHFAEAIIQKDPITGINDLMMEFPMYNNLIYEDLMSSAEIKRILRDRDVDLIILDCLFNEVALPIVDSLNVPYIYHCSSGNVPWMTDLVDTLGGGKDYASVPYSNTPFNEVMTFWERITNLRVGETFRSARQKYIFDWVDDFVKKDFPNARPSYDIYKDVSLVIVNSHPTTDWPRALPPVIIPIGAPHTRPSKPLPSAFEQFANEAENGFIIFSLGSLVDMKKMPVPAFQAFMEIFKEIPHRVIWKWEGEAHKNLPSNIMMADWLPQQDLIGHRNAKLFISHCGMLGFQELIYHGVPVLCLPFGYDQKTNADRAVREGFGLKLNWDQINEENLRVVLKQLLNDPRFHANAKKLSSIMQDELIPGADLAVYWIEYAMRHGVKHLQLGAKEMPLYQRHLLDIMAFLIVLIVIVLWFIRYVISFLFCRFGKNKSKDTSLKKKS